MATALSRLQFVKACTDAAAGIISTVYTLDALSNGIIIKGELNGASGSMLGHVRWISSDSTPVTLLTSFKLAAIADTTAVSETVVSYNHAGQSDSASGTGGPILCVLDGFGLKSFKLEIISFTTVTKASLWVAGK